MEQNDDRAEHPQTAANTRRRGRACERCNRRRTKCDGWIIGTPCSGCKQSSNHEQCIMIQSRRRRGADGRYTTHESPPDTGIDVLTPGQTTASASSSRSHPHMSVDGSITAASPMRRDDRRQPGTSTSPLTATSPHAKPSYVGESWYASYVMRGYKPGHTSFHRSLNDRDEPVQSISSHISRPYAETTENQPPSSHPQPCRSARAAPELPPSDLTDRLIGAYFARFHVFCPILVKSTFFASLSDGTLSPTLLRCVLFVASIHCDMEVIHLMRYSNRLAANVDLSSNAMAAFDSDQTSDRTSMFLSSYLLHYWFGNPSTYRDAHWWLAAAIRSAQCMGYHRSTRSTQMPKAEKARWKRVWWCLYVRDRQTSLSTGTPMVINDSDHDVEELMPEDLADETPETVRYIISQVELNKAAARLYFDHCSPPRLAHSRESSVRHLAMEDVQRTLKAWHDAHPFLDGPSSSHHLTLTLKVCYNYYLINLHQRLQRQSPGLTSNPHILDAAASVFSLVDDSLLYWTQEHFPMIYISALFSAMMALAVDAAPPEPQDNQLLKTIRPGLLALKQFETVYVLARWIRNFFMNNLLRRASDRGRAEGTPGPGAAPEGRMEDVPIPSQSVMTANMGDFSAPVPLPSEGTGYAMGAEGFLFEQDGEQNYGEGAREGGWFWPSYLTQSGFPNGPDGSGGTDFPQPDSYPYQALHFLADLGMAGFEQP